MPYIVICKKPDGSIEVAAHADEAPPELLQDAQPAASVDEAAQLVKDVLGEGEASGADQGTPEGSAPDQQSDTTAPSGAEGMPMATRDDQMAAGYARAKKGY